MNRQYSKSSGRLRRLRGGASRNRRGAAALVAAVALAAGGAQANDLTHNQTVFNTDFASGGVGGLRNHAGGTINLSGVSGPVDQAILYWQGPSNSSSPTAAANITLNGNPVVGQNIGFSSDNCWGFQNSQAYRANVTPLVTGNGAYTLGNLLQNGFNPNGASLLVFSDDGDSTNDRDIAIFEGNDSNINNPFDAPGWNITLTPINYTSGMAEMEMHVSDGQSFSDAAIIVNSTTLVPAGGIFEGDTVSPPSSGPGGNGALWDIKTFDVTSFLSPGPNTLNMTTGVSSDCLSAVVIAMDLPAGSAPPPPGNNPPIADAGPDATVKAGASTMLDGTDSFDPDGDPIASYSWTETSSIPMGINDPTLPQPTVTAPPGSEGNTAFFDLVVTDPGSLTSAPDEVAVTIVANSPPVADAGADQTKDEGMLVTLNGTASFDPDIGDTISYSWNQIGGPSATLNDPTSSTPTFPAPPVGTCTPLTFELTVTDDDFPSGANILSDTDETVVTVCSINDPPQCELARPDPEMLWPPNHKLHAVSIVGVTDPDNVYDTVTIAITGITQDEPVDGLGDGDTSPDGFILDEDPDDRAELRAERSGLEDGRVYVISFEASDGFESCTGSVEVGVPHDRRGTPATDNGQFYDSTQP